VCRYDDALLEQDYNFGSGRAPVAAFANTPHDVRSICIAVVEGASDPQAAVLAAKPLGAPVVFACHANTVQWWKQTTGTPELRESINSSRVHGFFREHKDDFRPDKIFEGKTRRRLPGQTQLDFVDAGLMPFIERTDGERLSRCVETAFREIESALGRKLRSQKDAQNAIKATFWLLAAKALHDKKVDCFKTVDLANIDDVFARVGRHYGVPRDVPPPGNAWREATARAAARISGIESLRNLSTESLAHVYENAMVTAEVRKANGTHSTPGSLVDYIVWQLWPWIEALPRDRRHVFEPACGHAAFLLGALRVLRQWSDIDDGRARHDYLKKHLHGIEYDPFALEVARLSLTLADIPHGNTWDLKQADMFLGTTLEVGAKKCGVLLANPPYEKFTKKERAMYARAGVEIGANTKACEMLRRTIPHLNEGACFGVVVPQGFLHSKEGASLRRKILSGFELREIDIFGDELFEKSDHEAAVLMGRRKVRSSPSRQVWFRRVRNATAKAFRERFAFSSEEIVDASRFAATDLADLRVPELGDLWKYLSDYPMLKDSATLGKGLDFKGRTLPKGAWTTHAPPKECDTLGFANVPGDLSIFGAPPKVGMNLSKSVILHVRAGMPYGKPQVLLNYHPVSRDAWRLKATLDTMGLAITSSFIAVRPIQPNINMLYVWAILNSPIANAFACCHLGKRDVLVGTMQKMPVPRWSPSHAALIEQAAMRYRKLAASPGQLFNDEATPKGIRKALLEMDAAVLQAYDLPPRLERQLLDLFAGVPRKGVGCTFTGYYSPGFSSSLPLHMLLSERFQRAAADVTSDRFKPGQSEHVRQALAAAAADTDEE
jgi:type I restriction-modification system DNA methylase subunit